MVTICDMPKYRMHKMNACEKQKIELLSKNVNKNKKKAESKYVFRKILNAALDDNEWVCSFTFTYFFKLEITLNFFYIR